MKIGFIILTFKPPDLLFERLLQRIREIPGAEIAMHHDYSQSEMPTSFIQKYRIHETPNSYVTKWSHINNVLATLEGFETLYQLNDAPDWYVTLTPNCYPIKTASHILDFYQRSKFNAYIQMRHVSFKEPKNQIDKYIIRDFRNKKITIPFVSRRLKWVKKELFFPRKTEEIPYSDEGYQLWHGSNWLSLDKVVVEKMIKADLKNHTTTKFYLKQYSQEKDMHPCPQEIIIPSFVGNLSEVKICHDYYRYIDWNQHQNWHPNILSEKDFENLSASDALWARKFEIPQSQKVIDRIDKKLI